MPFFVLFADGLQFGTGQIFASDKTLAQQAAVEQVMPALGDFIVGPGLGHFAVEMQYNTVVIARHCRGIFNATIDGIAR